MLNKLNTIYCYKRYDNSLFGKEQVIFLLMRNINHLQVIGCFMSKSFKKQRGQMGENVACEKEHF